MNRSNVIEFRDARHRIEVRRAGGEEWSVRAPKGTRQARPKPPARGGTVDLVVGLIIGFLAATLIWFMPAVGP